MSAAHILLIEDDDSQAALAIHTLQRIDNELEVTRLNNGREFVNFFEQSSLPGINLAILDLHMPGMDGLEALRTLKRRSHRPPFPVIVFSSSENTEDIATVYEQGGSAFVSKPRDTEDYQRTLRNIVNFWISTNRLR